MTFTTPDPVGDSWFGVSVSLDGGRALIGADEEAHLFDSAAGTPLHSFTHPTLQENAAFGVAVALDGSHALIGAPLDDGTAPAEGAAFVFDATTGTLVTTIPSAFPLENGLFGAAVAIDGGLALIGAPLFGNGGVAAIFDAETGTLLHSLFEPHLTIQAMFGVSVALRDGFALVGTGSPAFLGQTGAHLFDAATGDFLRTLNTADRGLGASVALGSDRAAVGAPWLSDQPGIGYKGRAAVFDTSTGNLLFELLNPAPSPTEYWTDMFGYSVSISGNTIAVSAPDHMVPVVHLFDLTTGDLIRSLENPAGAGPDFFGGSVSLDGSEILIGNFGPGTAHRMNPDLCPTPTPALPSPTATPLAPTATPSPSPSPDCRLLNTFNDPRTISDGAYLGPRFQVAGGRLITGSPHEDSGGINNSGAAYIQDAFTGEILLNLTDPSPSANARFGWSVAISETVALVGSLGRVFAFDPLTGGLIRTFIHPSYGTGELATQGQLAVIGAPTDSTYGSGAGLAYLFDITTGALLHVLARPSPLELAGFGSTISLDADRVLVGEETPYIDEDFVGAPRLHLYDTATGAHLRSFKRPPAHLGRNFGNRIAITEERAVVGVAVADPTPIHSRVHEVDLDTGAFTRALRAPAESAGPGSRAAFGADVDIAADGRLFVSHPEHVPGTEGSVYSYDAASVTPSDVIGDPDTSLADYFGGAIAVDGDWLWASSRALGTSGVIRVFSLNGCATPVPTGTPAPSPEASPTATPSPSPAAPTPSPAPCCPGDADNSGSFVDANDFIAVQAAFGADNGLGGPGDADCSGSFVDANDFIAVQANFGADCG